LIEDIEWAIDIVSENKLYAGNLLQQPLDLNRPEIRFQMDRIKMANILTS
jgi:hypothetical protein